MRVRIRNLGELEAFLEKARPGFVVKLQAAVEEAVKLQVERLARGEAKTPLREHLDPWAVDFLEAIDARVDVQGARGQAAQLRATSVRCVPLKTGLTAEDEALLGAISRGPKCKR
jgi:hypothetical protein